LPLPGFLSIRCFFVLESFSIACFNLLALVLAFAPYWSADSSPGVYCVASRTCLGSRRRWTRRSALRRPLSPFFALSEGCSLTPCCGTTCAVSSFERFYGVCFRQDPISGLLSLSAALLFSPFLTPHPTARRQALVLDFSAGGFFFSFAFLFFTVLANAGVVPSSL